MKIMKLTVLAVTVLGLSAAVQAAPIESMDSAMAKPALQKVDLFLSEQAVVAQLSKLGVSADQAHLRLAKLNDVQLAQLAAEVDKLNAGGDIQTDDPHPMGPIGCIFKQIGITIAHFFKVLFCWTDVP